MKIKPYVEKLNSSKEFKDFRNKHKDSFMAAGFFILDYEFGKNMHQIDYYIPSEKKIAAFTLDRGVTVQLLEGVSGKTPSQLDMNTNIDLDAIQGILQDEMKNRSMTEEIKKVIAILQNIDGKKIWNLNCVLSGMEILKAHVEDESKTVLKMDKSSIFDYIKKAPLTQGAQAKIPTTKKDIESELDKLAKLEKEIEKEKESLKKELNKSDKKKAPQKDKGD